MTEQNLALASDDYEEGSTCFKKSFEILRKCCPKVYDENFINFARWMEREGKFNQIESEFLQVLNRSEISKSEKPINLVEPYIDYSKTLVRKVIQQSRRFRSGPICYSYELFWR